MPLALKNALEPLRESIWREHGLAIGLVSIVVTLFGIAWVGMDASFDRINQQFVGLRSDMTTEFGSVRSEIAKLRSDMTTEFSSLRSEHGNEIRSVRSEIKSIREELHSLGKDVGRLEGKLAKVTVDKDPDIKLASNTER